MIHTARHVRGGAAADPTSAIAARDSNARAVLVIDKNGQAIARAGETEQLDVTSLSSLTAGNVAATGASPSCSPRRSSPGSSTRARRPTSTSRSWRSA